MITPSPATYDDLATTTYDMLYTYDDPMRSQRITDAMQSGTVTRDGPSATVSWTEAGDVVDGLEPVFVRDHFIRSGMGNVLLNANPTFETDVTNWTAYNGASITRDGTAKVGSFAMLITPNGVGSVPGVQSEEVPVLAGRSYTIKVWYRLSSAATGTRNIGVQWYDASHAQIGVGTLNLADAPGTYVYHEKSFGAPINAAYVRAFTDGVSGVLAATETWRVDDFRIEGPPATAQGGGTTNLPVPGYTWTATSPSISQDGEHLVISPVATNALYLARLLDVPPSIDFDVAIKVKASQLMTGNRGAVYLFFRMVDTSNYMRARLDFNIDQIIGYGIESIVSNVSTTVKAGLMTGPYHTVDGWYWLRVQGVGPDLRIKAWTDGQFQSDDWTDLATDTVYFGTPGIFGIGAALISGNTNSLPYQAFYFDEFFAGVNSAVDVNRVTTAMSLDDGLPQGATDTTSSGVADMTADLGAPVGVADRVYWSTFRDDMPYGDIPRDVAGVAISSGLVTADGIRTARLFTGQMADTPVNGQQVQLKGISRNRLRMTEPIQPPAVNGPYEGCEGTWPVSYALFKSRVYIAPPPIPGCRMYIPFHGSTHPMVPDTNGVQWPYGVKKHSNPSTNVWVTPTFVDGPFLAGVYCSMKPGDTRTLAANWDTANLAPGDDFWSQRSARGRIEFWVRGDPTDLFGSENNTETFMALVNITQSDAGRYVLVGIGCPDRRPYFQYKDGVNTGIIKCDPIPSDGQWHFIAASWNMNPGVTPTFQLVKDTQLVVGGAGSFSNANLPTSDTINRFGIKSYLPMSELRFTTGPFAPHAQAPWVKDLQFNPGAIMRRSSINLEGLAETTYTDAYTFINGFAQGDLAKTGFNENDQFVYLPPRYWAETGQQVEEEILSPDTNLDSAFTPVRDVNKVYNSITVNFKSATVQQGYTKIYESSEAIVIPRRSLTKITFPTLVPVIQPRDYSWAVRDGATHTALGINQYDYVNYVTANTAQDGTGTYATTTTLVVNTVAWDPGSITVQFSNTTDSDFYLTNNVNLPVIGMGGKILQLTDDLYVAENSFSIVQRNVRSLPVTAPAIQTREDASRLGAELAARLGQPKIRFTAKAFANPERVPGRLVRVQDPDATGIDRAFRIQSVQTSQEGPKVDQTISAQEALPILVWGVGTWGETIWKAPS